VKCAACGNQFQVPGPAECFRRARTWLAMYSYPPRLGSHAVVQPLRLNLQTRRTSRAPLLCPQSAGDVSSRLLPRAVRTCGPLCGEIRLHHGRQFAELETPTHRAETRRSPLPPVDTSLRLGRMHGNFRSVPRSRLLPTLQSCPSPVCQNETPAAVHGLHGLLQAGTVFAGLASIQIHVHAVVEEIWLLSCTWPERDIGSSGIRDYSAGALSRAGKSRVQPQNRRRVRRLKEYCEWPSWLSGWAER
jgi:hypothetical protein